MSQDDPQIVALAKCRYDFCRTFMEVNKVPKPPSDISLGTIPASYWAICSLKGDMATVSQVWEYLFREWLPASGWQPASIPAMEVFHRRPEEIGWDQFDMDCCLPLMKLR
jgi:AraC family transcriptional regulator